ncbi:hypothetical protein ACROYT_G001006 [Oculina patagonica]
MYMKVINDHRSEIPIEAIGIKKPETNSGLQQDPVEALEIHCDDHLSLSNLVKVTDVTCGVFSRLKIE